MPKLTKTVIEKATAKDKPYFLFDDQLAGFCARITLGGKKTYYVQYMFNKKIKRVAIGAHGIFTTERARNHAIIMLGEIQAGADPQKEQSLKRHELFVKDLAERYMEEHVIPHCKPSSNTGQPARPPFLAEFIVNERSFFAVTTHVFFGDHRGEKFEQRLRELEQMAKGLETTFARQYPDHPVIFAGDMNVSRPDGPEIARLLDNGFDGLRDLIALPSNLQDNRPYDQILLGAAN